MSVLQLSAFSLIKGEKDWLNMYKAPKLMMEPCHHKQQTSPVKDLIIDNLNYYTLKRELDG